MHQKFPSPSAPTRRRLLMAAAALGASTLPALAQSKTVLRISTPAVPDDWHAKMWTVFKDSLDKSAPGEFDVQINLNATLFKQGAESAAMARGNLELTTLSAFDIAKFVPEFSVFTAGYMVRDPAQQQKIFQGPIGAEMFKAVSEKMDVTPLATAYLGTRQLNLREVPRFDEFCGFIFVNYDADAISLADYLADAGDYLRMASQHGIGDQGMEIVNGTQTYCAKANWKLLQENSADGYHADTTHATYMDYIKAREGAVLNLYSDKGFGRVRNLKRGHSVSESIWGTPWGRPCARAMPSWGDDIKAEMDGVFEAMATRIGRERADFICHGDRNLLIFPNLVVNDVCALTIRTFYPKAPDYFEVNAWALAPKGESQRLRDLRLRNYLEFLGPGGFATPDDQEMLELCQKGYDAGMLVQALELLSEAGWCANTIEQGHVKASRLMQKHPEYSEDTMRA
jgi:phenylpropionate dioxygenase-like ring-hydroxylating dioxygenase large terminal subunit